MRRVAFYSKDKCLNKVPILAMPPNTNMKLRKLFAECTKNHGEEKLQTVTYKSCFLVGEELGEI